MIKTADENSSALNYYENLVTFYRLVKIKINVRERVSMKDKGPLKGNACFLFKGIGNVISGLHKGDIIYIKLDNLY